MDAFLASIIMFGGNFDPHGWEYCNGQVMPLSQNTALFSLLGTAFGGDGRTTFALPDMRGRVPMHPGSDHSLGEKGGVETVSLTPHQMGISMVKTPMGSEQSIPIPILDTEPHTNLQPYLCVNFIICTQGIFPSRK
jgi:microcystin-dependent protein